MAIKRFTEIEDEIRRLDLLLECLYSKHEVTQAGPIYRKLNAIQSRLRRFKFRNRPDLNPEIKLDAQISEIRRQIDALPSAKKERLASYGLGDTANARTISSQTAAMVDAPAPKASVCHDGGFAPRPEMSGPWQINIRRSSSTERMGIIDPESLTQLPDEPKVSVIMTAFNAESTVESAVQSILDQTYGNIEVIIVDDLSTDNTLDTITRIAESDKRVQVISVDKNRGTYWAKNIGLCAATGEVITFMDSDDVSDPHRIAKQLQPLQRPNLVATYCNCIRVNESGDIILNRRRKERLAPISLMIKRAALREVGWFDTVRTSADVELYNRLKVSFGHKAIHLVAEPLYIALHWSGSLTLAHDNAVSLSSNDQTSLAPARKHYQDSFLHWHTQLASEGKRPYVPFPLTNRPFPVYRKLRLDGDRFLRTPIVACMATFPARAASLENAVTSLIDQVDHLYIYMNGYDEVPSYLNNSKITAYTDGDDLRDAGKLYYIPDLDNAYCLLVDDDIVYPDDYAERLVRHIESYDRGAIIGVHGVIFANPLDRYFSKNRTVYSFKHALSDPKQVNALGTGTVAFHTSTITLPNNIEDAQGMVDIWLAIAAKKQDIAMYAIPREAGWMKAIAQENNVNLYDEFVEDDTRQTEMLRAVGNWSIS